MSRYLQTHEVRSAKSDCRCYTAESRDGCVRPEATIHKSQVISR